MKDSRGPLLRDFYLGVFAAELLKRRLANKGVPVAVAHPGEGDQGALGVRPQFRV